MIINMSVSETANVPSEGWSKRMKLKAKLSGPCLAIAAVALLSAPASAAVLDFESASTINDIRDSTTLGGGFTMLGADDNTTYSSAIFNNQINTIPGGAFSGTNYALNFNSRIGNIISASAITVNSLMAHADARDGVSNTVRFAGLDALGGNVLHTLDVVLSAQWQQVLFAGWTGVSVLTWDPLSPNSTNVGIDDVVYNAAGTPGPAPIPLPAALPLLGGGLSLLGLLGWRRKRTAAAS